MLLSCSSLPSPVAPPPGSRRRPAHIRMQVVLAQVKGRGMPRFFNQDSGKWELFQPQDFEWPSTPEEDNTDLGSVSDIGSDLSLGAVLGTCIITRADYFLQCLV